MSFGFSGSGSAGAYRGQEVGARQSQRMLTEAEDRLGKKRKADRIASEKSSMALPANIARIAAAYYTGGASEASGLGAAGSKALQGKRSDGSDYDDPMGDMVSVGAGAYNMMEGMKQKDISDLKAEDIAAYNRDIAYAKSFAEGSPERKQALMTARTTLEKTQTGQDYGDRADTNPFLYKKGRRDVEIPTTYFEGDKAIVTDAELDGKKEAEIRRHGRKDAGMIPEDYKDVIDRQEEVSGRRRDLSGRGDDYVHRGERTSFKTRQDPETNLSDLTSFGTLSDRLGTGRNVSEMADKIAMRDMMDREMDERSAEKRLGYDPALEKTTTEFKGSPISKTYLEKAAKKDESTSRMDKMSDEKHRVSEVKKAKDTNKNKVIEFLADKGFLPSSARDPLLVEDELIRRRELKRQHERFGTPDKPKPLTKSALRKRIDKLRKEQGLIQEALVKSGGTLSGGGSPGFDSAYHQSDAALLSSVK